VRPQFVRYVLEGSIRRADTRLRISAQLIEADTEQHLWADHFDGQAQDVFELQDQITAGVIGAIMPQLVAAEVERAKSKRPENRAAKHLVFPTVIDPADPPIRPERHVPTSIPTLRRRLTVALANRLHVGERNRVSAQSGRFPSQTRPARLARNILIRDE
jgi:hypothetical protein